MEVASSFFFRTLSPLAPPTHWQESKGTNLLALSHEPICQALFFRICRVEVESLEKVVNLKTPRLHESAAGPFTDIPVLRPRRMRILRHLGFP